MHVRTRTPLSSPEVRSRFRTAPTNSGRRRLEFAARREPPKFFLRGLPVLPPAAAEVHVDPSANGSDVILRLMWGPLPAPFPRAVAAIGLVLGGVLLIIGSAAWPIAATCLLLPGAALLYQRAGEKLLQARLSALLDGARFEPAPH